MNKELLKLKKVLNNLKDDKEYLQSQELSAIINAIRNNEITFEEFLEEFKTIV